MNQLNKSRLSAAFFGAATCTILCTTPGIAVAQSNITLYGVVDNSLQFSHSGNTNTLRQDSGNIQTTSWGIRGQEYLGNGYQAIFTLESGFNANNGSNAQPGKTFGRKANLGLVGPFGTVTMGLQYDELSLGLIRYSMGDLGHWNWGHASNNYDFFASTRLSNSVIYRTPLLGGFRLNAMYARGANGDASLPRTLGDTWSAGVSYDQGPLSIAANYESQVYTTSATITAGSPTAAGNFTFLGASYDFGVLKLGALAVLHRGAGGLSAVNATGYADPNNLYYDVSVLVPRVFSPHGSVTVSAGQYFLQSHSSGNSTSLGAMYDYHLSPRTGVYAGVAGTLNASQASFTQTGAQYSGIPVAAPGANQLAVLLGLTHSF